MILAHLPAGYILARAASARSGPMMLAALVGSVLPDFDLIMFYLIDNRALHHHRYWAHAPGFWLAVAIAVFAVLRWRHPNLLPVAGLFFASIFCHLVLDTVGGGIMWAWPVSDHLFSFITVPASQSHWLLSFLTHWSVLAEIAIIAVAGWLFITRKRSA